MGAKTLSKCIVFIQLFLISSIGYSQCAGGTNAGSITPGDSWQTISFSPGQYLTFSGVQAIKYTFSFCQGGGSASFDTQITILDNTGAIVPGAYNDDYCNTNSHLEFTAPSTATYRIYLTQWNCSSAGAATTFAYKRTFNDNPCSAIPFSNPSCGTTYTTYTTSSATNTATPGTPSCASYMGNDVWFKTVVPFSGRLLVSTNTGNITDGGMAIYKASSCSGPFTGIACDDDSGPGNMPQLNLSGLTPGDSIFIRFWAKNNAQSGTFQIYVNDPNPTYCYTGSATQNFTTGCIQVTPNVQAQSGCIWNKTQINLASNFNYYYYVNLGTNDGNGADGLCFAMQNSPAGMSALGTTGQNLGMGGIPNSVIVEFDTFDNSAMGVTDIPADHTAISINGNVATPVAGPIQASSTSANIEDGTNHKVTIDWNATTKTLRVYFDDVLRLTYVNDLVANVFGGNPLVYWGFSGSTGLYTNSQSICPGNLPGNPLPVIWTSFDAVLNGSDVLLTWTTSEEINTKEFVVERSEDGVAFQAIGSVKASGNSKSNKSYQFTDNPHKALEVYYRIKEVDLDENYSFSDIKYVNIAEAIKPRLSVSPNPVNNTGEVTLSYFNKTSGSATVILYDQYGSELSRGILVNGNQIYKLPSDLKSGMIYIVVISDNGTLNEKLMIADN